MIDLTDVNLELLALCAGVMALLVALNSLQTRHRHRASTYWAFAWLAYAIVGFSLTRQTDLLWVNSGIRELAGATFVGLLICGNLSFADRKERRWLLLIPVVAVIQLAILHGIGDTAARWFGATTHTLMVLCAGWILYHYIPSEQKTTATRFMILALGGLSLSHLTQVMDGTFQGAQSLRMLYGVFFAFALGLFQLTSLYERSQLTVSGTSMQLQKMQGLESMSFLTGGVVHDINNHLTAIYGETDLLLSKLTNNMSIDDEVLKGRLKHINQMTRRTADLSKSLLSLSRRTEQDADGPELLTVLLEDTQNLVQTSMHNPLEIDLGGNTFDGLQMGASLDLHRTLTNLLINAAEATTESGNVRLVIRDKGPRVEFKVTDTGRGMDAKTTAQALEPLFTTKGQNNGTGLGLYVSKLLVERHGGRFELQSAAGLGTTALFSWPIYYETSI